MRIDEWLDQSTKSLTKAGVESARLDCLLILETVSKKDQNWILTNGEKVIADEALEKFNAMLERRLKREPMAYIRGKKEFYGHEFAVTPDVLIPRPETEALVAFLVKNAKDNASILDMGTGSGAIAVAAKLARPDLLVAATDISAEALKVAKQNAQKLGAQIELIKSDLFDNIDGDFDLIAANLPYVPTYTPLEKELDFEPDLALFADDDGLDLYHKFFLEVEEYMTPGGIIVIEHDPRQFSWILAYTRRRAQRISNFVTALTH